MISVGLLGDVRLNREGLATLLRCDDRLEVDSAHTAAALPRQAAHVDVLVVDTATHDGVASLRHVVGTTRAPLVALGLPEDEDDVVAFAELGVLGFVERDASLDQLVTSIVNAAAGEASFPTRVATTLLRRVSSGATRHSRAEGPSLTVREREIVHLIAEGLSNKAIAAKLYIEVATVKNHVHNILEKLQVNRRADAVARLRLVDDRSPAYAAPARSRSISG